MSDLIPISHGTIGAEQNIPTVDGRDIWHWLGVHKAYSTWIKTQIESLLFKENQHFIVFSLQGNNPQGGRPSEEYHFTLDAAKHIAMASRTQKGSEARDYFILKEKELEALNVKLPTLISFAYLQDHRAFLESLGLFEDRDRLLLADIARTQLQRQAGLLPIGSQPLLTAPAGFDMEDAIHTLAPQLPASQVRKLTNMAGRLVAKEYRSRFQDEPETTNRFVDGKIREVKWYRMEHTDWVYPILQNYLAQQGLLPNTV